MRTFSLSTGDSGDTGDKAVITASRRVPTTKRAGGNTGDKFTRREAGSCLAALSPVSNARVGTRRDAVFMGIGVKISYAELRLVGEDCWPASGILMNCAGDRDSPRFVSIAKRPCLGRRRVAPTASYEIETRRYADT